ncbi:MAG: PIN domain-containing protein [Candidatus Diapherotrites archaeon]
MGFVDTCVLFAGFVKKDKYHKKAKKLLTELSESKKKIFYSDYVLTETLTLTKKRKGKTEANKLLDLLINSELIMLKVEHKHLAMAIELFKKFDKLSFTDCTNIALMLDFGIKTLYSFDKDFDSIPKIIRKEEV